MLGQRLRRWPSNTILYQTVKHNISSYNKILQKLIRNAKKTYYYSCFTKYKNDLNGLAQAKIIKKSVILFRVLNMTI